jgi:hypothetical protein
VLVEALPSAGRTLVHRRTVPYRNCDPGMTCTARQSSEKPGSRSRFEWVVSHAFRTVQPDVPKALAETESGQQVGLREAVENCVSPRSFGRRAPRPLSANPRDLSPNLSPARPSIFDPKKEGAQPGTNGLNRGIELRSGVERGLHY